MTTNLSKSIDVIKTMVPLNNYLTYRSNIFIFSTHYIYLWQLASNNNKSKCDELRFNLSLILKFMIFPLTLNIISKNNQNNKVQK
jgi:hypothetical protein